MVKNEPAKFLQYKTPDCQLLIISNIMITRINLKNSIDFYPSSDNAHFLNAGHCILLAFDNVLFS